VVLGDYGLGILPEKGQGYRRHLRAVSQEAHRLGLRVIASVCPVGYSSSLLRRDPNLAEGLPVRRALFRVRGREASLVPDPAISLTEGGFEQWQGDRAGGWTWQDAPGSATFRDTRVGHGGGASMRMESFGASPKPGTVWVGQSLRVSPFRQYRLSFWLRTEGVDPPGAVQALAITPSEQRLSFQDLDVAPTQDWRRYDVVFNSLANREVRLALGVAGARGGRLWWDDVAVEEVGQLNVLRRPGCPLVVEGDDGTRYQEGRDFLPVADPRLGTVPWRGAYEAYHPAPPLRLAPGTRLREGQRLRVSFYAPVLVKRSQVTCCLSEPRVYSLLAQQVKEVEGLLHPWGYLMFHDEIRVANWCAACQARKRTPGALLADNVRRCAALVRRAHPKAPLFVWSDMFDPSHNATSGYYLTNGSWAGSWKGLPRDVGVLNWNYERRARSLPFFAKQGHPQILAGYYDGDPSRIAGWLKDARGTPRFSGVLYTTWQSRYGDLEAFARAAWGGKG
jgi:hypothetical protein